MWNAILHGNGVAIGISWTFGIIGVIANAYIIFNYIRDCREKHRRKTSKIHSFLIANLATADLCGATYLIILSSADLYYTTNHYKRFSCAINSSCANVTNIWLTNPACYFTRFISNLSVFMPAMFTLVIAVDRFVSIATPHSVHRFTLPNIKIIVCICWLLGITIAGLVTIQAIVTLDPTDFDDFTNLCAFSNVSGLFFRIYASTSIIVIVMSYSFSLILYIWIFHHLRKMKRRLTCISHIIIGTRAGIEKKVGIITAFLALTNTIIWIPCMILFLMDILNNSLVETTLGQQVTIVSFLLIFANASANPISYNFLTNQNLQRTKGWI